MCETIKKKLSQKTKIGYKKVAIVRGNLCGTFTGIPLVKGKVPVYENVLTLNNRILLIRPERISYGFSIPNFSTDNVGKTAFYRNKPSFTCPNEYIAKIKFGGEIYSTQDGWNTFLATKVIKLLKIYDEEGKEVSKEIFDSIKFVVD